MRLKGMAEHKVVGRKIAIGLGVVCIVLSVGLVVALAAYLPMSAQMDSLNAQITQKDQDIAGLNLQITALQSQIDSLNSSSSNVQYLQSQISDLQQQIQALSNVLYLNVSATLVDNAPFSLQPSTNVTVWDNPDTPLQNAGYLAVQVQSSSNLTYVEVVYNSYGVAYDNVVEVSNSTVTFPVLPGPVVIVVGNTELADSVTGTVSAYYYY
jgi:cell division protein FtsL